MGIVTLASCSMGLLKPKFRNVLGSLRFYLSSLSGLDGRCLLLACSLVAHQSHNNPTISRRAHRFQRTTLGDHQAAVTTPKSHWIPGRILFYSRSTCRQK